MNGSLEVHPTFDALVHAAAERIISLLLEGIRTRGRAMIALSGGSTPRKIYALIGSEPLRSSIPWENVYLFWGDERCVLPDNPESNYKMVNDTLLRHIVIPAHNVHRVKAEDNPVDAARRYEEEIQQTFGAQEIPRFDLILLGVGEDGHTASLFPGTLALDEAERSVTEVYVDKLKAFRITMTFPVINSARHIMVLVSGKGKAAILSHVFHETDVRYPIQYVRPRAGQLQWFIDADAALQLPPAGQW